MVKSAENRIKRRSEGGVFYYVRRVPKQFAHVDKRGIIRVSLATRDEVAACIAAREIEAALEAEWCSGATMKSDDGAARYTAAVTRARLAGFQYRSAGAIASGPIDELLKRLEALQSKVDDSAAVDAILGQVQKPKTSLNDSINKYFDFMAGSRVGRRGDQNRRWENARRAAVKYFIEAIGEDKPISELTRDDARAFQKYCLAKVETGEWLTHTANKQMNYLSGVLRKVGDETGVELKGFFSSLALPEIKRQRASFSREFVEHILLAPGAINGLNEQARAAIYLCAETGMGPEEVASLRAEDIHLDAPIPYVSLTRRDGAQLKTVYRARDIPLVGVAMIAAQKFPGGLTAYFNRNVALSSLINKYFRLHGMRPTPKHSLYSLRHSFQDRLIEIGAPERMQADLMGHKFHREKYGQGPTLASKADYLTRMAYKFAREFVF